MDLQNTESRFLSNCVFGARYEYFSRTIYPMGLLNPEFYGPALARVVTSAAERPVFLIQNEPYGMFQIAPKARAKNRILSPYTRGNRAVGARNCCYFEAYRRREMAQNRQIAKLKIPKIQYTPPIISSRKGSKGGGYTGSNSPDSESNAGNQIPAVSSLQADSNHWL